MHNASVASGREQSVLVYDVGGSHVAAAVCFASDYRLGPVSMAGHPAELTSDAFLDLLYSLGTEASHGLPEVSGAELAMPGPFDFAQGVSWMLHKLPYLYGVNLRHALAARFGWQPHRVGFVNDADAFLLGEIGAGAARGRERSVGITLGTGIGSAFAIDSRVVTEGAGVPPGGEIWNLPYESGVVEDFVSSSAIRQSYEQRSGLSRPVAELAASAESDDAAHEAFAEFGLHLGRVLHKVCAEFAPEVVVLGGSISRSAHLFLPAAQNELDGLAVKVQITTLFDHAPLVGAAVAWASPGAPAQS